MNITLIKATESDAAAILKMQIECFTPLYERYQDTQTSPAKEPIEKVLFRINCNNGGYFKIIADDIHVGCVRVYEKSSKLYRIGIIYILPEFQNKGIGQKALSIAESLFPEAEGWELDCPIDIQANRKCYERAGYRFTGETKIINDKLTLAFYKKQTSGDRSQKVTV